MDNLFPEGQVTLTTKEGTYSAEFIERAIAFALKGGLTDQQEQVKTGEFNVTVYTPVGPIIAKPITEPDFPGFYVDWEVDGEPIALSTSEYQAEDDVFVVHQYADFSEDTPTESTTYYFAERNITGVKTVLERLRVKEEPN